MAEEERRINMNLKCKINGIEHRVEQGATFREEYNEILDSGIIMVKGIHKIDNLKPYDDVFIYSDDYEFDGYPTNKPFKFYKHLLVDNIMYKLSRIDDTLYNYTIELFSETKRLETIQLPNISITQPLDGSLKVSIWEYARRFIELYSPKYKVKVGEDEWEYRQKYSLDPSLEEKLGNIYSPDFTLNTPTLRELLSQLFIVVDMIPYVKDDVICAMEISKTTGIFDEEAGQVVNISGELGSENYADNLKRNYSNALSQENTCHRVEYLGFRNKNQGFMTLSDMQLETNYPIYKINKVYACYYKTAWSKDIPTFVGWNKERDYSKNDYVLYDFKQYVCINDIGSGYNYNFKYQNPSQDKNRWVSSLNYQGVYNKIKKYNSNESVKYKDDFYKCETGISKVEPFPFEKESNENWKVLEPHLYSNFNGETTIYNENDYVLYEDILYSVSEYKYAEAKLTFSGDLTDTQENYWEEAYYYWCYDNQKEIHYEDDNIYYNVEENKFYKCEILQDDYKITWGTPDKEGDFFEIYWYPTYPDSTVKTYSLNTAFKANDIANYNKKLLLYCDKDITTQNFSSSEYWGTIGVYNVKISEWNSGTSYNVGNEVSYGESIYRCTKQTQPGLNYAPNNSSYWVELYRIIKTADETKDMSLTSNESGEYIIYNNQLYAGYGEYHSITNTNYWNKFGTFTEWKPDTNYFPGTITIKNHSIYQLKSNILPPEKIFNESGEWEFKGPYNGEWTYIPTGTPTSYGYATYDQNKFYKYNGEIYKCIQTHTHVGHKEETINNPLETDIEYKAGQRISLQYEKYDIIKICHKDYVTIFDSEYFTLLGINENVQTMSASTRQEFKKGDVYINSSEDSEGKNRVYICTQDSNGPEYLFNDKWKVINYKFDDMSAEYYPKFYAWTNDTKKINLGTHVVFENNIYTAKKNLYVVKAGTNIDGYVKWQKLDFIKYQEKTTYSMENYYENYFWNGTHIKVDDNLYKCYKLKQDFYYFDNINDLLKVKGAVIDYQNFDEPYVFDYTNKSVVYRDWATLGRIFYEAKKDVSYINPEDSDKFSKIEEEILDYVFDKPYNLNDYVLFKDAIYKNINDNYTITPDEIDRNGNVNPYWKLYSRKNIFLCKQDITPLVKLNTERNFLSQNYKDLNEEKISSIEQLGEYRMGTIGYDIGSNVISGWGEQYKVMKNELLEQYETKTYLELILNNADRLTPYGINDEMRSSITVNNVWLLQNNICDIIVAPTSIKETFDNFIPFTEKVQKLKLVTFIVDYTAFYNGAIVHSKDDSYSEITMPDNTSTSLTLLEKDGIAEKEKINRFGNEIYKLSYRYRDIDDIQDLGTVIGDDNVIIYHRSYSIWDTEIIADYVGSKNYVLRNYYTSVYARHRTWNLMSYGETVRRAENKKQFVLLSLKDSYEDIENSIIFDGFTEKEKSQFLLNGLVKEEFINKFNQGVISVNNQYYLTDVNNFVSGYSLCSNISMHDSVSAGVYIENIYTDINLDYTDDEIGSRQQWHMITDETGFKDRIGFYLFSNQEKVLDELLTYNQEKINNLYTKMFELPKFSKDSTNKLIGNNHLVYKDNKELIDMTYQFEFISNDDNIVISPELLKLNQNFNSKLVNYENKKEEKFLFSGNNPENIVSSNGFSIDKENSKVSFNLYIEETLPSGKYNVGKTNTMISMDSYKLKLISLELEKENTAVLICEENGNDITMALTYDSESGYYNGEYNSTVINEEFKINNLELTHFDIIYNNISYLISHQNIFMTFSNSEYVDKTWKYKQFMSLDEQELDQNYFEVDEEGNLILENLPASWKSIRMWYLDTNTDNIIPYKYRIWNKEENYLKDEIVVYKGALYKAKNNIDNSEVSPKDDDNWEYYNSGNYGRYNEWKEGYVYSEGEHVIYKNTIYKCKESNSSDTNTAPDISKYWEIDYSARVYYELDYSKAIYKFLFGINNNENIKNNKIVIKTSILNNRDNKIYDEKHNFIGNTKKI